MTKWSCRWWRSMTGCRSHVFFCNRKSWLKKTLLSGRNTGSIAPLSKRLSTAVCMSWGIFLVLKETGVWASGGCDSHSNLIPSPTVHDAQQSPNSLCHCGANAGRRAPTICPSLSSGSGKFFGRGWLRLWLRLPLPDPLAHDPAAEAAVCGTD